ncbi:MAG: tetratricopeptide repeat protein, partial [Chloroflexota bacterium]
MDKSIGDLIRECRKAANLTQKQLGALIYHTDGSMISRFERGIALPSATTLNAIVDALSGRDGVPQEALQELIDFNRSRDPVDFVSDQSILLLLRKLDRFNPENRELVVDDLRRSIEINWSFFYAERIGRRRDWEQAAKELSALREMVGRHNERIYSRIDEALARCLYCDGSMLEAVRSYKRALASAEHFNDRYLQARIHLKLGDVYRRSGGAGFEQANETYEEAQKLFAEHRRDEAGGQLDDRNWEAISLRKQAGSLLFAGRPDKAEAMIRTSLKLSEDSQYNEGIYKAKQHLAWVSCMTGRWEDAVTLSEEALDLIPDENTWVKTKGWRYLGDAHRLARHLEKAKEAYETALDLFRAVEVGPSSTYALIMLGLAKLYLKQNLFTEARRHLEEGYKIHKRRSEDIRTVDFLAEYGKLFMRLGRYDEAEIRLREARDWFKELGNEFQYVHTLAMLCELYFEMDKW